MEEWGYIMDTNEPITINAKRTTTAAAIKLYLKKRVILFICNFYRFFVCLK